MNGNVYFIVIAENASVKAKTAFAHIAHTVFVCGRYPMHTLSHDEIERHKTANHWMSSFSSGLLVAMLGVMTNHMICDIMYEVFRVYRIVCFKNKLVNHK